MAGLLDIPGRVTQRHKLIRVAGVRNAITDHVTQRGVDVQSWPSFFPYVLYGDRITDSDETARVSTYVKAEIHYPSVWHFRGQVMATEKHIRVPDGTVVKVDQVWIDRRKAEGGLPTVELWFLKGSACYMEPHSPLAKGGSLPDSIVALLNSPVGGEPITPTTTKMTAAMPTTTQSPPTVNTPSPPPTSAATPPSPSTYNPANETVPGTKEYHYAQKAETAGLASRGGRRFRFGR